MLLRSLTVHRTTWRQYLRQRGLVGDHTNPQYTVRLLGHQSMGQEEDADSRERGGGRGATADRLRALRPSLDQVRSVHHGHVRTGALLPHSVHLLGGTVPHGGAQHRSGHLFHVRPDRIHDSAFRSDARHGRTVDTSGYFRYSAARGGSALLQVARNSGL